MRSGNGRHRRPRQAPALLVAVSVTGAGLALPLMAAGGAQAADTGTWDKVAQCETGGTWTANTDNGFYGGLGLTLDLWRDYGGTAYAERPDLASRAQQIAVAEAILNDRGPDAWPSCAVDAGLDVDGLLPDVDPGDSGTAAPDPSGTPSPDEDAAPSGDATPSDDATDEPTGMPTDSAEPEDEASAKPSDSAEPSGKPTAEPSEEPSAEPSDGAADPSAGSGGQEGAPGAGRHRGGADDSGARERAGDRASGRHASRGDADAHRHAPGGDGAYTVRSGDNLSSIAERYGLSEGWTDLYDANKRVIGADPDLIHPGQELDLGR